MKKIIFVILFLLLVTFPIRAYQINLSELGINYIENVKIISKEEIEKLGAKNLPEILRSIGGIDVYTIASSQSIVGIRGSFETLSGDILVLVDGKDFYLESYGGVLWEGLLNIRIEEIERIEIYKGPLSSRFSSYAYRGIINIVTNSPTLKRNTDLSLGIGNFSDKVPLNAYLSTIERGFQGNLGYKAVFGVDFTRPFKSVQDQLGELYTPFYSSLQGKGLLRFDYIFKETHSFSIIGGVVGGDTDFKDYGIVQTNDPDQVVDVIEGFLRLNYQSSFLNEKLKIIIDSSFKRGGIDDAQLSFPEPQLGLTYNTLDFKFRSEFNFFSENKIWFGFDEKYMNVKWGIFEFNEEEQDEVPSKKLNLFGFFVGNKFILLKSLFFILEGRLDSHTLTHFTPSFLFQFVSNINEKNSIILSTSSGYSNPTFLELYNYPYKQSIYKYSYDYTVSKGNEKLSPEKILQSELTYKNKIGNFANTTLSFFGSYSYNLIVSSPDDDLENQSKQIFQNFGKRKELGVDFETELKITPNIDLYIYDTFTHNLEENQLYTVGISPTNTIGGGVNANYLLPTSFHFISKRVIGNINLRYLGEIEGFSSPYLFCNLYIGFKSLFIFSLFEYLFTGYRVEEEYNELGIFIYNLFNNTTLQAPYADTPERRFMVTLNLKF